MNFDLKNRNLSIAWRILNMLPHQQLNSEFKKIRKFIAVSIALLYSMDTRVRVKYLVSVENLLIKPKR